MLGALKQGERGENTIVGEATRGHTFVVLLVSNDEKRGEM